MEKNNTYVNLDQLETLFSQDGYICLGHGTGRSGNFDESVDEIFTNGLRTKDNSLFFNTIGLSTPTPYMIAVNEKLGVEKPSMAGLKRQLDNWPHLDSKRIIIIRLPIDYINMKGDSSDLDGEKYGAFYIERENPNGNVTYYLDPIFIVGCYNVEKGLFRVNDGYERTLSETSLQELQERCKKTVKRTEERLSKIGLPHPKRNK